MTPKATPQESANAQTVDAAVAHAVKMSCDAVKASIQQCRTTAELVCSGQYGLARIPRDLTDFICRFVCLTGTLSTSCFDLLAACVCAPADGGSTQQGGASGIPAPTIQVVSRKTPEVTLSTLTPASPVVVPVVVGLFSADPTLPAIRNVRFSAAPDRSRLVLHIRIDDNQPAGTYIGFVIDSDTNQPLGTLTVRVL